VHVARPSLLRYRLMMLLSWHGLDWALGMRTVDRISMRR
jgi:hypothetical protein